LQSQEIQDCWDCKADFGGFGWTSILDMQVGLEKFAGPGHWNDPDMLEVLSTIGWQVSAVDQHFITSHPSAV
jgi:hypothetical protein